MKNNSSTAHIKVRDQSLRAIDEVPPTVFERLEKLIDDSGPGTNRNELAIVLIQACITAEIDRGSQIVGVISSLGFDARHVGAILSKGAGNYPDRHWKKDGDGRYRLHR